MGRMAVFYAKVIADETLRVKVFEILNGKDINQATDEQLTQIGELAKAAGFNVSLEEAKAYLAADTKDLSDEALEAVAGGGNKNTKCSGDYSGAVQITTSTS